MRVSTNHPFQHFVVVLSIVSTMAIGLGSCCQEVECAADGSMSTVEQLVLKEVNNARRQENPQLPVLVPECHAVHFARQHEKILADRGVPHTDFNIRADSIATKQDLCEFKCVGEVAVGFSLPFGFTPQDLADKAVLGWKNSDKHWKIITSQGNHGHYNSAGVAVTQDAAGIWFVTMILIQKEL